MVQILFVIFWVISLLWALYVVWKLSSRSKIQKLILSIVAIIFPIVGSFIVFSLMPKSSVLFWQNSATKDQVWLAGDDSSDNSSSSDFD